MIRRLSILTAMLAALCSQGAMAAVPQSFSVQGVLRDKGGALQSITATVIANFFAADKPMAGEKPLNANPVVLTGVGVSNGLFTVNIPMSPDLSTVFGNPQVWLELTVNSDTFPRQLVTPNVYSLMCGTADNLAPTAKVDGGQITPGTLPAVAFAPSVSAATWTAPTLLNGWVNYANGYNDAGFYKDALGWVHLKGLVKLGPPGSVIFTLPTGFRPAQRYLTVAIGSQAGYVMVRVDVETNGNVSVVYASGAGTMDWVTLDQVHFKGA
jgi:hypothetical protein